MIKSIGIGLSVIVCVTVTSVAMVQAADDDDASFSTALTRVAPNPADVFSLNANLKHEDGGAAHMLKWETVAQVRSISLGVYFDGSTPAGSIRLSPGGPSDPQSPRCLVEKVSRAGKTGNDIGNNDSTTYNQNDTYVFVRIQGKPGSTRTFRIPIDRLCNINDLGHNNKYEGQNNTENNRLYGDYSLNGLEGGASDLDLTGKYKFTVTVAYSAALNCNDFTTTPLAGCRYLGPSNSNSFNYILTAPAGAKVGALQTEDKRSYGLRSTFFNDDGNDNFDGEEGTKGVMLRQQFGFPCNALDTALTSKAVSLYDPDVEVFGPTYIKITKGGSPLALTDYESTSNVTLNDSGNFFTVKGSGGWFKATTNNGISILKVAKFERGVRYRFVVINPIADGFNKPNNNVFSMNILNDAIYGDVECNYKVWPDIELVSGDKYSYTPEVRVKGSIGKTGNGPVSREHPWEMYAVRFSKEPNTRDISGDEADDDPCKRVSVVNRIGGCQSIATGLKYKADTEKPVTYTSGGPDAPGTRLCFFTRIQNPTETDPADDATWRYSDMLCAISNKRPNVQILGTDLKVGSNDSTTGNISTSSTKINGLTYGSWVEYGVFSTNINKLASSGSGLRGGNADSLGSAWSKLTFANTITADTPDYGTFGSLQMPNARSWFAGLARSPAYPLLSDNGGVEQPLPSESGVYLYEGAGTIKFNGSAPLLGQGKSIIIQAPNGTVKLTGGINVPNAGRTKVSDISQVVIVANNINIEGGVENVDAWLLARDTINTCSDGPANLSSGDCNKQLNVSGAVVTKKLLLRRTAGADAASPDSAAEIFRLRPDSQLWAYNYANSSDRAKTIYIKELPPRF